MPDEKDILWDLYKQNIQQGLHHQNQRTATTNILLGIAGGILALINYDHRIDRSDQWYSIALIGLGAFGTLLSWKYRERYSFYVERANCYRDELQKLLSGVELKKIEEEADKNTHKKYKLIHKARVANFWILLNALIMIIGIIFLYLSRNIS